MARIGFLSLSATGHINPSMALAKAMQDRRHETVFFNILDREHAITERGLDFVPYGPRGVAKFALLGSIQTLHDPVENDPQLPGIVCLV